MEDMIGYSAHDISMAFLRDVPLSNQDEKEDMIRFDLEVCLFCEQICKEMKKLLSSFPTSREEEKQHQITVLQSVSDAISRFCVAHGQPATELEEGHQATMPLVGELKTDSDEGHAATELDTEDDSMDSEEKEQESSDSLEVEEKGMDKIDAVSDGATETEEAPWFDIYDKGKSVTEMQEKGFAAYRRSWEREWGEDRNSFENLCT
jgi:hypothetical protein